MSHTGVGFTLDLGEETRPADSRGSRKKERGQQAPLAASTGRRSINAAQTQCENFHTLAHVCPYKENIRLASGHACVFAHRARYRIVIIRDTSQQYTIIV